MSGILEGIRVLDFWPLYSWTLLCHYTGSVWG